MDNNRWQRVERLCQAALERERSQQADFLDSACAGDEALRGEVESLLTHVTQAEQFIEAPALEMAARALLQDESYRSTEARDMIGRVISDYRIVRKLATGGMGEVYTAVRADGTYEKQVAIKFVQSGLSSDFFLARFKNERQILASLDHPNIARLIDGGSTEEGLPYLVMEYIEGLPIDEYCERHGLDISERLKLFRTVCCAVQYAHKNLVIHRDLKPRNILVTQEGVPKLLDFGIAKILDPQHEPQEFHTITLLPLMTPDYASPEQIRNEVVTTSSDVYSLGVTLYVLLARCHPYKRKGVAPHELIHAICDVEPERPSSAVVQTHPSDFKHAPPRASPPDPRGEEVSKKLHRALVGDLDKIVLKALRKETERRYSSVEQFSEDIRRYFVGLPVVARKDTLTYRARKFIGRHKLGLAAVALTIFALVAGLIATLREARIARFERSRAERRFSDVRSLANSLMFDINDSIQNLSGSTPARKLLVTKALEYLDSLSQEAGNDPSLQKELAFAYEKVGDLQGDLFSANLGDTAGALASYRNAMAIRESLAGRDRNSLDSLKNLSADYQRMSSSLIASGQYKEALDYAQKYFDIQQGLAAIRPGPESQERLAGAYYQRALCQSDLGNFDAAAVDLQKSAGIREAIVAEAGPGLSGRVRLHLAGTYGLMAVLLARQGGFQLPIAMCRRASDILTKLSESDPSNAMYREYLNESYYYLGFFFEGSGDLRGSLKEYRRALAGFEALASADPKETRARRFVGKCQRHIGTVLVSKGEIAQGLEKIRKGVATAEELYRMDPGEKSDKLTDLADAYAAVGFADSHAAAQPKASIPAKFEHWEKARAAYNRSLEAWLDAKRRGAVAAIDADEPNRVARELASCDAALARLTGAKH